MTKKKAIYNPDYGRGSGKSSALAIAFSAAVICALPHTSSAAAEPAAGVTAGGRGVQQESGTPAARGPGRPTRTEPLEERGRRFSQRALDDLRDSLIAAQEETTELEREVDRIALLESPKRETDLRDLLTIYADYAGWLADELDDIQAYMSAEAEGLPGQGVDWSSRYGGFITRHREYARRIDMLVKSYDAELRRLTKIIERRRFLRDRSMDLERRLTDVESSPGRQKPSSAARTEKEKRARQLREELRIAQTELLSLDDIDKNLPKHFVVMIHRGKAWLEWNAIKTDEYAMLREASQAIKTDTARNASAWVLACRQVIRGYEREKERLGRGIDRLDRMRERVSPAGTLREIDRSRELLDFFDQEKGRYRRELERVGVQTSAWEAELSEALSGKQAVSRRPGLSPEPWAAG